MRQIMDYVPEHDRVNVVAEHVQQHPIAQLWSAHDVADGLPFDQPKPYAKQVHAHSRGHYYDEPKKRELDVQNCCLKLIQVRWRQLMRWAHLQGYKAA